MDTPTAQITPPPAPAPHPTTNNHTLMAVLAYLGILVIIPYLMSKDVLFVKFHIKQGAVLAIIEIILWLVSGLFGGFWFIIEIIQLAALILSIIGIANVLQNKEQELPVIGHLAHNLNI